MLDVYDSISDLLPGGYTCHYIRLSRKAIALAHPSDLMQNVIPLAGKMGRKNVGQWLGNFAVSPELYEQVLNRSGLTPSSAFGVSEILSLREACRSLRHEITAEQHIQKTLIRDYIRQQMGGRIPKRVGIVDTGWACTTQDTIRSLLDEAELLSGIYFGVSRQGQFPQKRNLKYGLLRDDFRRVPHHNPVEASAGAVRMWDTLLREPAGSVLRLERKGTDEVIAKQEPMREIGTAELTAADMIRTGIRDGLEARRKGVAGLVAIADQITDRDFEIAATTIARNISTRPNRKIAAAIIRMGFDEGSASGKAGTIGLNGLIDGVAWYSGILSSIGLRWTAPFLELFARMALRYKRKSISTPPCGKTIN